MASQVFYRKWRPRTFAEVAGQGQVTQTLNNALNTGRVSHAYLFCGPRGTGKTSTGRILAKAVNCLNRDQGEPCNRCDMCRAISEGRALDVIEIDAASNRGIDEIRELRERVNYAPNQARYKVYIVDEVHMLTKEAANALLKTLEEPPPYVIFILATTEVHKVPATILSRCQRFDFKRISQADVAAKLSEVCRAEGISIEPEGLRLVAQSATGSLRDAENLLEQLTTYYGTEVGLAQVQAVLGISGDQRARELVRDIVEGDVAAGVLTVNGVSSDGLDLRQFNREVVAYLRELLLVKSGSEEALNLTPEDVAELKTLASRTSLAQIARAIKLFSQLEFSFDNYSTLPLELALVDCAQGEGGEKGTLTSKPVAEAAPSRAQPVKTAPPSKPRAASPKPTTPKTEPPPSELHGEIERLRVNWRQVFEQAPEELKRAPAVAILRSAGVKPLRIEDDTVVLAFRYPIHKEKMETLENQQVAEKVISSFLGRPCRVRYVYEPENNHLLKAALKMGAQVTSVEEK